MTRQSYDPSSDGAKMNFKDAMSYGDYLQLDGILDRQHPLSTAHDEMLFIIQHQTSELWMKLALHEMSAAREALKTNDTAAMFKMLARVSRIFEQLNSAWDVLRTMTPADYTTFREALGTLVWVSVVSEPDDRIRSRQSQSQHAEAARTPPRNPRNAERGTRPAEFL